MAIVSVTVSPKSSGSCDENRVRKHKLTYIVKTNDPTDTDAVIMLSSGAGLPVQFVTPHPHDSSCRATSLDSVERDSNDPNTWYATYNFDNATRDRNSADDGDPTNGVEIQEEWSVETVTRAVTKDRDGNPILNSAGDPFDPIEVEDHYLVLMFERPEASFDVATAGAYNNAVNSTTFYGAAPGTMRVRITARAAFRNQIKYFNVRYEFRYRPDGWQPKLLQQGFRQLINDPDPSAVSGARVKVPCFVTDGEAYGSDPVTSPVPIDANGEQIPSDQLPAAAVYEEFLVFEELDFNLLGL